MNDWNETKEIIHEVGQLFQSNDDIQDIQDIAKMNKEIDIYYVNNIKDLKDKIKVLSMQINSKEAELAAPSDAEHSMNIRRYINRKDEILKELSFMRDQIDAKRENISNILQNSAKARDQINESKNNLEIQESRISYAVSLYSKISHITWDYTAPSSRLAGHVLNDKKSEISQFDIDSNASQFDITNKLWDLIGSAVE